MKKNKSPILKNSNPDIIIIGGGLLGSMSAKHFRSVGLSTLIIDMKHPYSASKCSLGAWKENWLKKIRSEFEHGKDILEEYSGGIIEFDCFNMNKFTSEKFRRVSMNNILNEDTIFGTVTEIDNKSLLYENEKEIQNGLTANIAIVVCAGAMTEELLNLNKQKNVPETYKSWGAILQFNKNIDCSRYKAWTPYENMLALKIEENKILFSDGCKVKHPKPNDKKIEYNSERLLRHSYEVIGVGDYSEIAEVREGHRVYLRENRGYKFVNQHDDNLFSATGCGKQTTVLMGHIAKILLSNIKDV